MSKATLRKKGIKNRKSIPHVSTKELRAWKRKQRLAEEAAVRTQG